MRGKALTYLLHASGEVLHVPDRHRLVRRQVDGGLRGEEAEDLPLRRELGAEVLHVDELDLGLLGCVLVALHFFGLATI